MKNQEEGSIVPQIMDILDKYSERKFKGFIGSNSIPDRNKQNMAIELEALFHKYYEQLFLMQEGFLSRNPQYNKDQTT